jgi:ribosomal-protein-alanine N-acetyltransferase
MIYEMAPNHFHVLTLAVDPAWRRKGIGRALVERLINKLSPHRRHQILLEVRETNLVAQLFFRSLGFRASRILRNFYADTVEHAYLIAYENSQAPSNQSKNRIARYFA